MPKRDFLIFSDLHAHNFRFGSKRVPYADYKGLYNSRLVDTLTVLQELHKYAVDHDIDLILFAGDLFHSRHNLSMDAFNLVSDKLHEIAKDAFLYMLPGNHDYADREGNVVSFQTLASDGLRVLSNGVEAFSGWSGSSFDFVSVAYTDSIDEAKDRLARAGELASTCDKPPVLLAHLGMQGAKVGSDYILVSDGDISTTDVPYDKFSTCFFGHFHQHQKLFPNGWYVGATHQHNWGDSGGSRGFLHVTLDEENKVSMKQIETSAPKFVVLEDTDFMMSDMRCRVNPQDFVRVYSSSDDLGSFEDLLESENVEVINIPKEIKEEAKLTYDKLNPHAVLSSWVKKYNTHLDEEDLLLLGKKLLSNAEGTQL